MNVEDVSAYLRDVVSNVPDITYRLQHDDHEASARLWRTKSPDVWAEVASPGVMWVRLAVSGGFILVEPDDSMSDAELLQQIDEYLVLAGSYLEDPPNPRGRFFPSIALDSPIGPRILKRSLVSDLRHILLGR